MIAVKKKVRYKIIDSKPYCADAVICHVCGARRECSRCEILFYVCESCRMEGHKLTPVIVNDPMISFATGEKRSWWCDECWEMIS